MVTKADIEIAVKGIEQINRAKKSIGTLSTDINNLNKRASKDFFGKVRKGFQGLVLSTDNLNKAFASSQNNLNKVAIGTRKYFEVIDDVLGHEEKLSAALKRQAADRKVVQRLRSKSLKINSQNIRLIRKELEEERKLAEAKERTAKAEEKRSKVTRNVLRGVGGAVGSGIIGGAFPLLFGQGPLSAIGGGLGGLGGGALSAIPGLGQFGFALSIAGTAIGTAMEDLSEAISKPEDNIENLINKLGLVNSPTAKLAKELENMGLKSSASKLLLDKFNEKLGQSPEELLRTTQILTEFKNQINLLGTEMTLFLSGVLSPFIKAMSGSLNQGKLLRMLRAQVGEENMFRVQQDIVNTANRLAEAIVSTEKGPDRKLRRDQLVDQFITIGLKDALGIEDFDGLFEDKPEKKPTIADKIFETRELEPIRQQLQLEKDRLKLNSQDLNLKKENFKLLNQENELKTLINERDNAASDVNKTELDRAISKLKEQLKLQMQIVENAEQLADPFRQLSNIISQDIGNGIKGLIKGTQSLNDLLLNVVNKIGDAFLNAAIFGNFGGGSVTGGLLGVLGFADGGRPPVGRASIVGERGPELFVPNRSGTIIPNNKLGGGNNTSVVVNVDASGSDVQGDEEQATQFGSAIATAIQSELIRQQRPGGLLSR